MALMADETSNRTRPGVGFGLTLVSTLGPTLGLPLPISLRWVLFAMGVILLVWPVIRVIADRARKMGIEPIHLQIVGLAGVIFCAALALGGAVWQSQLPIPPDTKALQSQLESANRDLAVARQSKATAQTSNSLSPNPAT